MLHACDQRFDVTENLENFCELNKALRNLDNYAVSRNSRRLLVINFDLKLEHTTHS